MRHWIRLAGIVAGVSGLVGGCVWFVDWQDRADGDALRWGHWHNPFMEFPPFHEGFLEWSMLVLLGCSVAAGVGGLLLLGLNRWGVVLVVWQARVAVMVNVVVAVCIVPMLVWFAEHQAGEWHLGGTPRALALRVGAAGVGLALWGFVGSRAVRRFFDERKKAGEAAREGGEPAGVGPV